MASIRNPVEIVEEAERGDGEYDRAKQVKAFDETKAGVKGLVDGGITKVPRMFIQQQLDHGKTKSTQFSFPVIDLDRIRAGPVYRQNIVSKILEASESWGFFQIVNHGIPLDVLEEMLAGIYRFHEQDSEVKKQWYSRESNKTVTYNSNIDLFTAPAADWRDTLNCIMRPHPPNPADLPEPYRDILLKYTTQVIKLGSCLFELLSESLGLESTYLTDMGAAEGLTTMCHYYPKCPQPELTIGTRTHSDSDFLTVLLQDHVGGFQVLHQNQWVDVPFTPGSLVVNIGDLLQLVTNDRFKSVKHRVLANRVSARVSVACFFTYQRVAVTRELILQSTRQLP